MLKVLHLPENKLVKVIQSGRLWLPECVRKQKSFILDTETYSALIEIINTDSLGCANVIVREVQAKLFEVK